MVAAADRVDQKLVAVERARGACVPRGRANLTIALVVLLGVVEIVLGIVAYGNFREVDFAIALACLGVVGFAVIDCCIRPRFDRQGAEHLRRYMPFWSLLPFLCALASSSWVHYQQWESSLADIRELARELNDTPTIHDAQGKITADTVEATLTAGLARRFPGELAGTDEKRQFHELARVIGHDLKRAHGDPREVVRRARRDTLLDFVLALGVQALFVLWIPFLLMISIARAGHKLATRASVDCELGRSAPDLLPATARPRR